jgi:hypothetical protein
MSPHPQLLRTWGGQPQPAPLACTAQRRQRQRSGGNAMVTQFNEFLFTKKKEGYEHYPVVVLLSVMVNFFCEQSVIVI